MKYVSDKDRKPLNADLKTVYHAPTEEKALEALRRVTEKWNGKVSGLNEKLEAELGCDFLDIQVLRRCTEGHLHEQRH